MKPKISIIIPVYNAEKYLRECLDSILNQSFQDFEILLINDGSTDGSPAICDEYAAKDWRVKVFHKENGGVSSARNLGLDHANGEWITFVDSDDFLNDNFIDEKLNRYLKNLSFDLIINNAFIYSTINKYQRYSFVERTLTTKDFLKYYGLTIVDTPWAKFFKRSIIKKSQIFFNEQFNLGEDLLFNMNYLLYSNKIALIDHPFYNYRNNEQGLSSVNYNYENDKFLFEELDKLNNLLIDNFGSFKETFSITRLLSGIYYNENYSRLDRIEKLKLLKSKFPQQFKFIFRKKTLLGGFLQALLNLNFFEFFDRIYLKLIKNRK